MGKVKKMEKQDKSATEFDKKNPASRVKSINDEKQKKKLKKPKVSAIGGAVEKEVKPLVKEAKKEIAKALKAKKNLLSPKTEEKKVEGAAVELPEHLATRDILKKAVKAIKQGVENEKEAATAKNLFDEELRFGLQVVASKIPKTPPHTKKILLDHSLFGDVQPDICFIIRDGKSKKAELIVDESVQKFEEKLREAGITNVKTIMPLATLKKDYGPNNMKLKLLNTYDLFLVESEIAEHVYTILGKHFIKKRKRPLQIDTSKMETMKISIEHGTRKVSFKVSSNSNFSIFEVGTLKMENSQIVDNIVSALEQLKEKWPGGWKNVLRLYLKPMKPSKVSIPIYYSKVSPNDIEVPVEVGVKQTRLDKINEQLARRSKKLRLDRKTKKVVKVKGVVPAKGQKKDKKRKVEAVTEGETPAVEEKPKKKKKNSETEVPAVAAVTDEPQKKKKKKTAEPEVVEAPKEAGKKKKDKNVAAVVEPEQPAAEKKDKKKKKTVVEPAVVEASPEKASKKKNKKK